jgi:hypothetical protein
MNMKTRLYKTIVCSAVTILIMTTLGSFWWVRTYYPEMNRLYFQVWMKTSVPDTARLYYDIGKGLSEEHAIGMPVNPDGLFHRYRLALPDRPIQHLRFDPLTGHGMVSLKGIEIVNGLGRRVHIVGLQQLHPAFQIKTWILNDNQVDLETDNQSNDPQITIHINTPITTPKGLYLNLRGIGIIFFLRQIGIIFFLSLSATLILVSLFYLWIHRSDEVIHTLIVLWFILTGWLCLVAYDKPEIKYLQLSMRSSEEGKVKLYYDIGNGFSKNHSTSSTLWSNRVEFNDYRFRIPDKMIYSFRLDPVPSVNTSRLTVRSIDVVNVIGAHLQNIPLDYLQPANEIGEITREDRSVTIHAMQNSRNPQMVIHPPYPIEVTFFPWKSYLSHILPQGIIIGLSFIVFFFIWKMTGSLETGMPRLRWVWEGIILLSCLFLFIRYAMGTWHHTMKFVKAWIAFL